MDIILSIALTIPMAFQVSEFDSAFKFSKEIVLQQQGDNFIGSVRSSIVDLDLGVILISDSKIKNVKVYALNNGNHLKTIGREGRGPEEFLLPFELTSSGKKIYVTDLRQRRLSILNKDGYKFIESHYIFDGRKIKIGKNRIIIAAPNIQSNTSLHFYDLNMKHLKSAVPIPLVTKNNDYASDGVTFDIDNFGNIYLAHETEYAIYKLDSAGNLIAKFMGSNEHYKPLPEKLFREASSSRKKATKWMKSWTHISDIVALKKSDAFIINMVNLSPSTEYILDIYDSTGNILTASLRTNLRLLCADDQDALYFLEESESDGEIEFRIKKYHFQQNRK